MQNKEQTVRKRLEQLKTRGKSLARNWRISENEQTARKRLENLGRDSRLSEERANSSKETREVENKCSKETRELENKEQTARKRLENVQRD